MIAGIAALSLILLVMMFITRSIVAAFVIVGRVSLSLGASFGLSVLIWQDIFGIELYWIVLALAVILLLAVGSDYNLSLISRSDRDHDRPPSAVRHADRAFIHDPGRRSAAGPPVLVAAEGASPPRQPNAPAHGSRQSVRQLLLWEDDDPIAEAPRRPEL